MPGSDVLLKLTKQLIIHWSSEKVNWHPRFSTLYWHFLPILQSHNKCESLLSSLIKSHSNMHCIVWEMWYITKLKQFRSNLITFSTKSSSQKQSKIKLISRILGGTVIITDFQTHIKSLAKCFCFLFIFQLSSSYTLYNSVFPVKHIESSVQTNLWFLKATSFLVLECWICYCYYWLQS